MNEYAKRIWIVYYSVNGVRDMAGPTRKARRVGRRTFRWEPVP